MKLINSGITIDVNPNEAQRYLSAGYVEVKESVEMPAEPQPEPSLKGGRPEVVEAPKARKLAKKKG